MPFCNQCGCEYGLGPERCARCAAAFPQLSKPPQVEGPEGLTVPRMKRFTAGLIDLGIAFLLFFAFSASRRFMILVLIRGKLAWLVPLVYLLLKDSVEGKSIGKLVMGLVVYNEREKKAGGFLDSIIRNWYLAIPFLGPTLLAVVIGAEILSGKRKRLGDEGAGTIVITDLDYQRLR